MGESNSQPGLQKVLQEIDEANAQDPRSEQVDGEDLPQELAYSRHMSRWLFRLEPEPNDIVQIACRAQHIERWKMPRSDYPEGRKAYYQWRQACGRFHAERAAHIMARHGYDKQAQDEVYAILTKQAIKQNPNTQLMEDVACLVFLERYFAPFYQQKENYDQDKWLRIITRTWNKMSERGHQHALTLVHALPEHLQTLLNKALTDG